MRTLRTAGEIDEIVRGASARGAIPGGVVVVVGRDGVLHTSAAGDLPDGSETVFRIAAVPGTHRAGTGDWAGIFNSYYWIDRTSGVAGAFFTQVLPFFDAGVVETLLGVEQGVYGEPG